MELIQVESTRWLVDSELEVWPDSELEVAVGACDVDDGERDGQVVKELEMLDWLSPSEIVAEYSAGAELD